MSDGWKLALALAAIAFALSLPFIGALFQSADTPADRACDRARRNR